MDFLVGEHSKMKSKLLGENKPRLLINCSIFMLITLCWVMSVNGDIVTFNDQTEFLSALSQPNTLDFETSSGFPQSFPFFPGIPIGMVGGIDFDANVFEDDQATSGTQVMVGNSDTGGPIGIASIDFSGFPTLPTAFGFFGLDLVVDEIIKVDVDFASGNNSVFDVTLGANPEFTPSYFGFIDDMDAIETVSISTTGIGWFIDDLTINAVPEPSAYVLMATVALTLTIAAGYKQKKHT